MRYCSVLQELCKMFKRLIDSLIKDKSFFHILSFLFISSFLAAQPIYVEKDEMIPRDIIVRDSGIYAVSKNNSDTIITDTQTGAVIYSYPEGHESFWHKIIIESDCEITFNILPAGAENIYNFFLYKNDRDFSPKEIKEKDIAPFRANLCKNEMAKAGTGISIASAVNFYDASSKTKVKDFYYTQYHAPVYAKKGDVLILNVYHIKGSDCGYQFTLNADKHSQKFQTSYRPCYMEQLKKGKYKRAVNFFGMKVPALASKQIQVKPQAIEPAKATFVVRDSIKHSSLDAEINFVKFKGLKPVISSKEKGKYEFALQKSTQYHLLFSAVGYKNTDVFFISGDSAKSFTNDVYLSPLKEGDNFVMDKIYFYPNTYSMKPGATGELNKLITYLKANPGINIEIQGHTSGNKRIQAIDDKKEGSFSGSAKKLSQLRAERIKKYLMENGIAAERLIPVGYGGSQMIYPNPKTQAEANKNIRVAILLLPQKEGALSSLPSKEGISK